MRDLVALELRRNRGWPWPENSFGLSPMHGDDGWWRSCGIPRRAQSGPIILQRRDFGNVTGAWVPNWSFDVFCLETSLAAEAAQRFNLSLLEVKWHGEPPGTARQIVAPTIGEDWFDAEELRERTEGPSRCGRRSMHGLRRLAMVSARGRRPAGGAVQLIPRRRRRGGEPRMVWRWAASLPRGRVPAGTCGASRRR